MVVRKKYVNFAICTFKISFSVISSIRSKEIIFLLTLSVMSGLLLLISWLPSSFFFLLFIAFVPLIAISDFSSHFPGFKFAAYSFTYLSMLIWNLDLLWMFRIDWLSALLTILLNSFVLSLPFLLWLAGPFHKKSISGYVFLLLAWLAMEVFHHNWFLAFPFFIVGNGLADHPRLIQWYEYTGVWGGSLWIMLINILIYKILRLFYEGNLKNIMKLIILLIVLIFLPVGLSQYIYNNYRETGIEVNVAAIHTNLSCYDMKYNLTNDQLADSYISASKSLTGKDIDMLIWPETALPQAVEMDSLQNAPFIRKIMKYLKKGKGILLITGIVLKERITENSKADPGGFGEVRVKEYNAAVCLNPVTEKIQVKSKYKCVPFTEYTPRTTITQWLKKIIPSLGGFGFSLNEIHGKTIFTGFPGMVSIKPLICYESAFCNFNPAPGPDNSFLCIILNEGWYNDMKVASQFMYFAALRAVEQRKSIIRSSNSGISCSVSQKGDCYNVQSQYGNKVFISLLKANNKITFFVRHLKSIEITIIACFSLYFLFGLICYFLRKKRI
jgi:apolipoprotein N-acyltransferase